MRTIGFVAVGLASVCLAAPGAAAQAICKVAAEQVFPADGERVRLARDNKLSSAANFALFRAPLAVDTDGAPTSYHPEDFLGETRAINRIDNGIVIRRADGKRMSVSDKISAFNSWKASGWKAPQGLTVGWKNVIAADPAGKPCVFKAGEHAGYFGSLTATQNGLPPANSGECQVKNQLDQRFVPAIVLRGNANPLRTFGAKKGDLVLALNPGRGGAIMPAIIGDTGNGHRIGEGSVALNMKLLGVAEQPRTYKEALKLDTGSTAMIVAVLPGTAQFDLQRPYTAENIAARVGRWAADRGYGSVGALAAAITACASGL